MTEPADVSRQLFGLLAQIHEQPSFVYAHYLQPHRPYNPPGRFAVPEQPISMPWTVVEPLYDQANKTGNGLGGPDRIGPGVVPREHPLRGRRNRNPDRASQARGTLRALTDHLHVRPRRCVFRTPAFRPQCHPLRRDAPHPAAHEIPQTGRCKTAKGAGTCRDDRCDAHRARFPGFAGTRRGRG